MDLVGVQHRGAHVDTTLAIRERQHQQRAELDTGLHLLCEPVQIARGRKGAATPPPNTHTKNELLHPEAILIWMHPQQLLYTGGGHPLSSFRAYMRGKKRGKQHGNRIRHVPPKFAPLRVEEANLREEGG